MPKQPKHDGQGPREYTHTICQFNLDPDNECWTAIVIAGRSPLEIKEVFLMGKIADNTDLLCGDLRFCRMSNLIAHLETVDFKAFLSGQLPAVVRPVQSGDILT